ncbi:MAG: hypothetical protein GY861_27645 [bacterium]|nr:hypothetical protein [bacterium]
MTQGKMKLRAIVTILFFTFGLFGSIAGGLTNYYHMEKILSDQANYHLETAVQSRAHHVTYFLDDLKHSLEIAATHSDLSNDELREIVDIKESFDEVFVLDGSGKVVASSDESHLGLDFSDRDFFVNGKDVTFISEAFYSEITKKRSIAVSTPHSGGVMVARLQLDEFDEITTDRTGMGETGEIYMINKEANLITHSRFMKNEIMVQEVKTENADHCLKMLKEGSEAYVMNAPTQSYLSYLGETVFGTHIPIPEIKGCLLAELDEAEVIGISRTKFIKSAIFVSILTILFISLVGLSFGRKIEYKYSGRRK